MLPAAEAEDLPLQYICQPYEADVSLLQVL
jgi:hypothetical protein